jgi:predicted transcriptional regulator
MELPGSALHVAIKLWFHAGLTKSRTVAVSLSRVEGLSRWTASDGLKHLEQAGLVVVERHAGRKPIVTLLDAPPTVAERMRG